MRLFLSAGEPSGDLHGANLVRAIQKRAGRVDLIGFGGDKMAAAGVRLLFPLASYPIIGIAAALRHLPMFFRLRDQAAAVFRKERPDAVVLIDYPGFHWHLARAAKEAGIPVYYHLPPQIWGWATWRVNKMRRFVDRVLCTLPFEESWYHERGVPQATYVGHPYFDELDQQELDGTFVERLRESGGRRVALLPGSRGSEVRNCFPRVARIARKIAASHNDVTFHVAGYKQAHVPMLAKTLQKLGVSAEVHVGRTPEIIEASEIAIAVSGSVSLELLYRKLPTVIVYHIPLWAQYTLLPLMQESPYITLVNLLAGRMLFPEYYRWHDFTAEATAAALHWLDNEGERLRVVDYLAKLKRLYAIPGATDRVADLLVRECAALATVRAA